MADCDLRHGYTLRDLEMMSRAACKADRSLAMDYHTKHDIAYSAITLALYEAEHPPERQALIRVGWQAIYREVRDTRRQHGLRDASYSTYDVRDDMRPKVLMYWDQRNYTPSHEHRVVERLAVVQVLNSVSGPYRDAVLALAAVEDYQSGALVLDISYKAFIGRMVTARKTLLAAWFGDETPHRPKTVDRRRGNHPLSTHCPKGHEFTPQDTGESRRMVRGGLRTTRRCRVCQRERDAARGPRHRKAA